MKHNSTRRTVPHRINNLIYVKTESGSGWVTCPDSATTTYLEMLNNAPVRLTYKIFNAGKMPLEELPEDIQKQVRETLKCYDSCTAVYEHGAFHVTACTCICNSYADDHFVCGHYFAKEVFTPEERRNNFAETFGYSPRYHTEGGEKP